MYVLRRLAQLSARPIYVGTYHKTGTVWMIRVFQAFAEKAGRPFVNISQKPPSAARSAVLLHEHSVFDGVDLDRGRGIRVIRDPRDVIISGMHYHRKSTDAFLHRPMEDGRTYQQILNAMESDEERLLFELHNAGAKTIREMLAWQERENFRTVRYEDLMSGGMACWRAVFAHLGVRGRALKFGLNAAWENSLFGAARPDPHIRKGTTGQWREAMPPRVVAEMESLFPDALHRLGYSTRQAFR